MSVDLSGFQDAQLSEVPLEPDRWQIDPSSVAFEEYGGRRCLSFADDFNHLVLPGVELTTGMIELDLAVSNERSFHGVTWHVRDTNTYESFFVRPHQVGNPDAIQYTPVINGVSSWQLYHGPGFWAPTHFPVDAWFTIRIAFNSTEADVSVGKVAGPTLRIPELKLEPGSGGVGILVGGPGLRVGRFAVGEGRVLLTEPRPADPARLPGTIGSWEISDPFPEHYVADAMTLDAGLLAGRSWTSLAVERSGLVNLARAHPLEGDRNTVLARAVVRSAGGGPSALQFGFSDRAVVFNNGSALFRGNDAYRSRDYRFLGSIGYWDTVVIPLEMGDNELVVAVSEDFGGWGLQGRFLDPTGLVLP